MDRSNRSFNDPVVFMKLIFYNIGPSQQEKFDKVTFKLFSLIMTE